MQITCTFLSKTTCNFRNVRLNQEIQLTVHRHRKTRVKVFRRFLANLVRVYFLAFQLWRKKSKCEKLEDVFGIVRKFSMVGSLLPLFNFPLQIPTYNYVQQFHLQLNCGTFFCDYMNGHCRLWWCQRPPSHSVLRSFQRNSCCGLSNIRSPNADPTESNREYQDFFVLSHHLQSKSHQDFWKKTSFKPFWCSLPHLYCSKTYN